MNEIEKLELELTKSRKRSRFINNKIEDLKLKEVLPKVKEKYEGKFWKYENSTDSENKWWIYSFCIEVKDEREGLFNSFEKSTYKSIFKIKEDEFFYLCQIEITIDEFNAALELFRIEFNKLGEFS